ncbi:single-stranded DNA-binding protein, partial [Neisseria elongata]|uniref:single-stranded DNA-binding protein n=1 Tax=Neisseria elongata TaxID=495 RepID=UPI0006661FEB
TGQRQERTEWHNITLYHRMAEVAGQYLKKGSLVYIEGRIQSRKYTGKDGIERTAYEIIGNEMKMLGGGNDSGQQAQAAQAETPTPPRRQAPAAPAQPVDDIDDDIPF